MSYNENYLAHYGVIGMKWGRRRGRVDKLKPSDDDHSDTRRVKLDYEKLSDAGFRRKYSLGKNAYARRVNSSPVGDPIRKLGYAPQDMYLRWGRGKASKDAKAKQLINDKIQKKEARLLKDFDSETISKAIKDKYNERIKYAETDLTSTRLRDPKTFRRIGQLSYADSKKFWVSVKEDEVKRIKSESKTFAKRDFEEARQKHMKMAEERERKNRSVLRKVFLV